MRVIAYKTLQAFWRQHPPAEQFLKAWYDEARKASWQTPADIKAQYRCARFVDSNRVVFNISGKDYRLIAAIAYRVGIVYIKFIGTHAQYTRHFYGNQTDP